MGAPITINAWPDGWSLSLSIITELHPRKLRMAGAKFSSILIRSSSIVVTFLGVLSSPRFSIMSRGEI